MADDDELRRKKLVAYMEWLRSAPTRAVVDVGLGKPGGPLIDPYLPSYREGEKMPPTKAQDSTYEQLLREKLAITQGGEKPRDDPLADAMSLERFGYYGGSDPRARPGKVSPTPEAEQLHDLGLPISMTGRAQPGLKQDLPQLAPDWGAILRQLNSLAAGFPTGPADTVDLNPAQQAALARRQQAGRMQGAVADPGIFGGHPQVSGDPVLNPPAPLPGSNMLRYNPAVEGLQTLGRHRRPETDPMLKAQAQPDPSQLNLLLPELLKLPGLGPRPPLPAPRQMRPANEAQLRAAPLLQQAGDVHLFGKEDEQEKAQEIPPWAVPLWSGAGGGNFVTPWRLQNWPKPPPPGPPANEAQLQQAPLLQQAALLRMLMPGGLQGGRVPGTQDNPLLQPGEEGAVVGSRPVPGSRDRNRFFNPNEVAPYSPPGVPDNRSQET
jgi:hypothetical protein